MRKTITLIFLFVAVLSYRQNRPDSNTQKKAISGNPYSAYKVGMYCYNMHMSGYVKTIYMREYVGLAAVRYLKIAAEKDYTKAYLPLARLYIEKTNFIKNYHKDAVFWLEKAVAISDPEAACELSYFYLKGKGGLDEDPQKGLELLKYSAGKGVVEAQYELGLDYCRGKYGLIDFKQAKYWISKAFEKGHKEAKEVWNDYDLFNY